MIKNKIKNIAIILTLLLFSGVSLPLYANSDLEFKDRASVVIMHSLKDVNSKSYLKQMYESLLYMPIWIEKDSISNRATELFLQIEEDVTLERESKLYSDSIRLKELAHSIYAKDAKISAKIDIEFKLSQLYEGYANYLLYGSINWGAFSSRLYNKKAEGIGAKWITYKPKHTPISLLEEILFDTNRSFVDLFSLTIPTAYRYEAMHDALKKYLVLQQEGGWSRVPLKSGLKKGKKYTKIIPVLRERLEVTGDYEECDDRRDLHYDACLFKAVKHFQKRHGLRANGVINKKTIWAINTPIGKRIKQMRLNLDRIKWLNKREDSRKIVINIPAFKLYYEENDRVKQQIKVIVGKRRNPTPIFSNTVTTVVLNPSWNIPQSIIQKEMVPKLIRNPNAMARMGVEIYTGWKKDDVKISGVDVDWRLYRYSKVVPFRFTQVSGRRNALGKIKFLFPNEFAVYMHDTPNKKLFKREVRAFSHGCIRLASPVALLKTFSSFNKTVDFGKSLARLKGKKQSYLSLENRVPVDVVYLTAYVDYSGVLQFRNDIYGYDKMQLNSYRSW